MKRFFPYASHISQSEYPRWNRLSDYFFHHYGEKVQKIPLDAGFSCPNRDGTISSKGCIFCNPIGSGTGLGLEGLNLYQQWETRRPHFLSQGTTRYVAYLQSFSNTYGPVEKIAAILNELKDLPGIFGLSIGTRPDCVDQAKLSLIANFCATENWPERWLELGVQSSNNATLQRIKRGHDRVAAEQAILLARDAGLKVCVHLIAGLPGEDRNNFLESVSWASGQDIQGIKFHPLYVSRGTELARSFENGEYKTLIQDEYVDIVVDALAILRPDIVIQRITSDPTPEELLAPSWAWRSRDTSNKIRGALASRDIWQGKNYNLQHGE